MACDSSPPTGAEQRLRELVQRVALAADSLQHVYAQRGGDGLDLVMFLLAADIATAEQVARGIVRRALASGTTGCRPISCQVELVTPFAEAALPPEPSPG